MRADRNNAVNKNKEMSSPVQKQKKRKEESKFNRVRQKYTNYFSILSYCKSDKENTNNIDKVFIKILKEIE